MNSLDDDVQRRILLHECSKVSSQDASGEDDGCIAFLLRSANFVSRDWNIRTRKLLSNEIWRLRINDVRALTVAEIATVSRTCVSLTTLMLPMEAFLTSTCCYLRSWGDEEWQERCVALDCAVDTAVQLVKNNSATLQTVHCFDTELEKPYERPYKAPLYRLWEEIVKCPNLSDVFTENDDEGTAKLIFNNVLHLREVAMPNNRYHYDLCMFPELGLSNGYQAQLDPRALQSVEVWHLGCYWNWEDEEDQARLKGPVLEVLRTKLPKLC